MKVKRMVEVLQKMPQDAEVRFQHWTGKPVLFVVARQNDNENVWLEGEEGNDMGEEIVTRLRSATDMESCYIDLLDTGIDVDMVRRYVGDKEADRMLQFCTKYNLL